MTTEELLKRCVNKDRNAWDEFVKRYGGLITRSVRYKLNRLNRRLSKTEVRDIVQEIFLLIWEKDKLSGVKNSACLKSWLAIVSVNVTSNYCRKKIFKMSEKTLSIDKISCESSCETSGTTLSNVIPSPKFNTAELLEASELKGMLEREISKLGIRQQLILKLNIYEGKRQKDIAKIMNIPEGTVATLLRRTKKRLQKRLRHLMAADV